MKHKDSAFPLAAVVLYGTAAVADLAVIAAMIAMLP